MEHNKHRTIIEPFKIKMVEPLVIKTPMMRAEILKEAGYNLFLVRAEDVTFDFLTDSGTTAMSANQWSAMMVADESYAGSRSFHKFARIVKAVMGYDFVLPAHQGRAAERVVFSVLLQPGTGQKVPSNNHFDTTRANIVQFGGEAVDLVIEEGRNPASLHPFKGNIDLESLESFCREFQGKIPFGMLTITNNTGGGQPVSYANIKGASEIYRKYSIPFFLDACRFAENAFFIKQREAGFANLQVREIVKKVFDLADGCLMSAKKDALVNIGGLIALRSNRFDDKVLQALNNQLILTEGFPTYGGLAARDLEAMAVGLEEILEENYLEYRIAVSQYMVQGLNKMGIPTVLPAGGHAVYIDAKTFLAHIPRHEFPGQSLVCELYRAEGVRTCEIGSVMNGAPSAMELVRLAFPRRVYTQSHFDYVLEGFQEIVLGKTNLRGYKITNSPPFLRHFTARFEPLG